MLLSIARQDFHQKEQVKDNHPVATDSIDTIMDLKLQLAEAMSTIDSLKLQNQRLENETINQYAALKTSEDERKQLRRQLDIALTKIGKHQERDQHLLRELENVTKERYESRRQLHNFLGYGSSQNDLSVESDPADIIPFTSSTRRSQSSSSMTTVDSTATDSSSPFSRRSSMVKNEDNCSVFSFRSTSSNSMRSQSRFQRRQRLSACSQMSELVKKLGEEIVQDQNNTALDITGIRRLSLNATEA